MQDNPASKQASTTSPFHHDASSAQTLSVGMPIYNGDKWIEESIKSILGQSMKNFELIISDNASTDNTEAICRAFAERDARVRYYRNAVNIGIYPNFNWVFELATGKYFKWAADSDICLDGHFEKCVAVLDARPDVVLVYPRTYFLIKEPDGEEVRIEYFDDFHLQDESPSIRFRKYLNREQQNNLMHGVIRASALRQTRLHLPWADSDDSMVAELSLRGKFFEVPDRLFVRRYDEETSSFLRDHSNAVERDVPIGYTYKTLFLLHAYRYITTLSAPISFSEKARVWLYLMRSSVALLYRLGRGAIRL